jgi:COMPASS component SWD3
VYGIKFSPNGKYVLAWTLDSSLRLWNYVEGKCVKTYQGHVNSKFSTGGAFGTYRDREYGSSQERAFVLSGSEDGSIWMWDVSSKAVLQTIKDAHEGVIFGADFHSNGQRLIASGGADGLVKIWKLEESQEEEVEDKATGDLAAEVSAQEEVAQSPDVDMVDAMDES